MKYCTTKDLDHPKELAQLGDRKLLNEAKEHRSAELYAASNLLVHLIEIKRRRLFAELGYSSLCKYLTKELSYSEGASSRRVKAVKLAERCPSIISYLRSGKLSLSNACAVQFFWEKNHLKIKNLSLRSLIQFSLGKTKDELQKYFFELIEKEERREQEEKKSLKQAHDITQNQKHHQTLEQEQGQLTQNNPVNPVNPLGGFIVTTEKGDTNKVTPLEPKLFEKDEAPSSSKNSPPDTQGISVTHSDTASEAQRLLQKHYIKRESSVGFRVSFGISEKNLEILKLLSAFYRLDIPQTIVKSVELAYHDFIDSKTSTQKNIDKKGKNHKRKESPSRSRAIPSKVKDQVFLRAGGICEFPGCGEIKNLEYDHIVPWAKGGEHTSYNLRLYCKAHNQRAAIKEYGQSKMSPYINP